MGGLFLIPSSCPGSLEWICFSWCKLWNYWQGGRKRERDNCHWSKISWEEKNHSAPNLYHCWSTAVLPPSLSHSAEPEGCPMFSLKAQRRAVSKLLILPPSSFCVVSAGDMIRVTTNHPLGTCGACSAPVLQPWLILYAAAAGSWTVLYCQKFSTRLRVSALPFTDRKGHVFSGKCMHAAVPGSMLSTQA